MTIKQIALALLCIASSIFSNAQHYTQTIRGMVLEKQLQKPIVGATVQIVGVSIGARTDEDGNFIIKNIPVGNHTIMVTSIGFKENVLPNLIVNSGKELVLHIFMEEKIVTTKNVVIKAESRKNKPLNELSTVSTRAFTVEETQRYAAAVNDPARMAANFAGVRAGDDGNNQIVIRGNSPSGLLWKMEGMDIPNPNHFAAAGSSGGGISILSTQVLANSDFSTGAFTSEYGNALSGVFDLKLRKGNNKKREYAFQAGALGFNFAAEGPFSKWYKGAYLINYRYSTLSLLSAMKVNVGSGVTKFQDLSYNIYLPTNRYGVFTLFGFGGLSGSIYDVPNDSTKWKFEEDRYGNQFYSNTGMWGATHSTNIGSKSLLKSTAGYSITKNQLDVDYVQSNYDLLSVYNQRYLTKKLSVTTTLNHKINSRTMLRLGIIANHINFNYTEKLRDKISLPFDELVNTKQSTQTLQGFSHLQYKLSENITLNGGCHYLQLLYNNTQSLEPRFSTKFDLSKRQSLSFGYGKHSQIPGYGIYFAQVKNANGTTSLPNKNLGFTKAHHFVVSHHYGFNKNLKLRTEIYYQALYNVPVSNSDTNTFSSLNTQDDYMRSTLVNKGTGRNYGIEISLEKYLSNSFYYMLSTSFYQSKCTASNKVEYNTRFNGNTIVNMVAGKEYVSQNKRRTLGLNVKCIYAGGYRTTPIDLVRSQQAEEVVYYNQQTYQKQLPYYMRADVGISMKWNRKRLTSKLSLDIQNVSNRQNVDREFYDKNSKSIKSYYQTGLIPILNYKIEF